MDEGAENILVIKLGALGDFIQALGPMAAIRRHHPHARITLLTTAPFAGLAKKSSYCDNIIIDKRPKWLDLRGWLALRRELIAGRFTRVYDLQNNDRTALYLRLFPGATKPEWVGATHGASHRNAAPERTAGLAFHGHQQTLALAGINDVRTDDLSWITGDITRFNIGDKPFVLLVPGAAPGRENKRWPAAYYGAIAQNIATAGMLPVVLGTTQDRDVAQTIQTACPESLDLSGKTSLEDIALLARAARAAVGNDTGPMHMIAPTGCPCLVLFSAASNPQRHAPLGPKVLTIQKGPLATLAPETVWDQLSELFS